MSLVIPNVMPVFTRSDVSSLYGHEESPALTGAATLIEVPVVNIYLPTSIFFSGTSGTTSLTLPGTESPVLTRAFSLTSV